MRAAGVHARPGMRMGTLLRARAVARAWRNLAGAAATRLQVVLAVVLAVSLSVAAAPCAAHKPSDSYLTVAPHGAQVDVRWDIALRDLDAALGLDADDDGMLTWGEVRRRAADIGAFAFPQLQVRADDRACTPREISAADPAVSAATADGALGRATQASGAAARAAIGTPARLQLARHSDGVYAVLRAAYACATPPAVLQLEYRLFAAADPTHRGIVRVVAESTDAADLTDPTRAAETAGATGADQTAVMGPDHAIQTFATGPAARTAARWSAFKSFVGEGIWHIWLGFDHILFLLALLLPAVLVRVADAQGQLRWQGVGTPRAALLDVLRIVTAFTVAHSITLTLAVLDVVALPSRLVESAIALTVILAALNNLWPVLRERRWMAAFGFGLIHGFGFAGALKDLGLPPQALAVSLFGFNVGVELGQLAIVAVFFPFAFVLRGTPFYRRGLFAAGSAAVAALAGIWLLERVFDLTIIGV